MSVAKPTAIDSVIDLLTRLASGDLDARGERSETDDDLDAVMVGINMLAEELVADRTEMEQRVAARTVELEAARAEALEGSRLKSEFLATMSHEIRTPMNGVIGLTNLLLQTSLDVTQRQYANGVHDAGEALLLVINDILDFSKLEAGMIDLELVDFDPRLLVESVASLLALTSARKGLELIAYCRPEVPERLVGDEGRLRQILLNLASNAVKFTDKGEVVITVQAVDDSSGRELLRFQVTDTGIGIPGDAVGRLFDSFTQADASTTRRFGGTGLGLAISRRLTEAMAGEIGLETEEGVGSTFWFEVPLPVSVVELAHVERSKHDLLRDLRVLIVDDNATNRLVLESQLTSWGMRPDVVEYPQLAISMMRKAAAALDPYAIAVLDQCMPDMDGTELAGLISADRALDGTRLIMLSSAIGFDRKELEGAGVREWLSKPVRSSDFFDRLMRMTAPEVVVQPSPMAPLPRSVDPRVRGRVLVVEDNSLNQLVAEGVVSMLGFQVDIVANGRDALEAIAVTYYSAVLMDCHMPLMDGFAATEQIRIKEGDNDRLPIIAMTAGAMSEDRDRCLAAGMDDFVSKPVDVATLSTALDVWARPDLNTAQEQTDDTSRLGVNVRAAVDHKRLTALRHLGPDDGRGLLAALTGSFLRDFPTSLVAMRHAVAAGDSPALQEVAHQLKGAAANMGAIGVTEICHNIEDAAATGTLCDLEMLHQLEIEFERVAQLLRAELTSAALRR